MEFDIDKSIFKLNRYDTGHLGVQRTEYAAAEAEVLLDVVIAARAARQRRAASDLAQYPHYASSLNQIAQRDENYYTELMQLLGVHGDFAEVDL